MTLYSKMAAGAAWMVLFKLADRLIGLCSIVVLARLLVPADFGLVALATAIVAVLELLGAFSFDVALIQRPNADRTHYDTAWTFNVIVGAAAALMLFALSEPTARFYGDARLAPIMHALALAPLVGSLQNIGIVAFRKELRFEKEFAFLLSKKLISVAVTMILAFAWRNYWALAAGILVGRLAGVLLSYLVNDYRPRFSLQRRNELLHFSVWLFFNNILSFVSNRLPDFVIGKAQGPAALGVYSLASEISTLPTTELVAPINRAIFPAYARMHQEQADLREGYLRVIGVIAVMTIPAALGIAAIADVLVPLIFGEKWLGAVPVIQVLAFYGLVQSLQNNVSSVYYALGKPRITTWFALLYNLIMAPAVIYGAMRWGSLGAAYALVLSICITAPLNLANLFRLLQLPASAFLSVIWRPAFAGAVMSGAVLALSNALRSAAPQTPELLLVITLVFAGALAYVGLLLAAWLAAGAPVGAEKTLLTQAAAKLRFRRFQSA